MNYLEIIELRSSAENDQLICEKLTNFVEELNVESEDCMVKLFRHLTVKTDWSFHLLVQSESKLESPSPIGLRIISALQEFGLVHHSVWSEKCGRKNEN